MMESRQLEVVRGKRLPQGKNNKFKDFDMEKLVAFWVTHTERCQNSFDFMNTVGIKEVEGKEAGCCYMFSSCCRSLYKTGLHSYTTIKVTGNFSVEGCLHLHFREVTP